MFLSDEFKHRVLGTTLEKKDSKAPPLSSTSKKKVKDIFFRQKTGTSINSHSSFYSSDAGEDAVRFSPAPPINVGPQIDEYDRLALVLHATLERTKNRRRIHEYVNTFYGKDAVDWLVASQVFPDATDARNALRHLLIRRIIIRADHTRPLFNDVLERFAPKMAQARRADLRNRYANPARGFADQHLYRFPPEAFSKSQLNVKVIGARHLRWRNRPHLGTFVLSAKFHNHKVDPYCVLEFGAQTAKTDTWSDGREQPSWETEFAFPIEVNNFLSETAMKDLWVRVFDFHEVLEDVEIGFLIVPAVEIQKNCASGRSWTAWHLLKPASDLTENDRTYGEVELTIAIAPFVAAHPLYTVYKEARPKDVPFGVNPDFDDEYSGDMITTTLDRLGNSVNQVTDNVTKVVGKAIDGRKDGEAGDEEKSDEKDEDRFLFQVFRCRLAPNLADVRKDTQLWVEYHIGSTDGTQVLKGKTEVKMWPEKEMGIAIVRGLTEDDIHNAAAVSIVVKVYGKTAGLTVKLGEAAAPLKSFLPDFDADANGESALDVPWKDLAKQEKLILKRTAAFRRNRRRIVGEIWLRAVVEPDALEDDDDVSSLVKGEAAGNDVHDGPRLVEDDLSNVASMLSENGFSAPDPLPNTVLKETIKDSYFAKNNFTNLAISEWKWGGRDRRSSYPDDAQDDSSSLAGQESLRGYSEVSSVVDRSEASETPAASPDVTSVKPPTKSQSSKSSSSHPPLVRQESLKSVEAALPHLPKMPAAADIDNVENIITDKSSSPAGIPTTEARPATMTAVDAKATVKPAAVSVPTTPASVSAGDKKKQLTPSHDSNISSNGEDYPYRVVTYVRPPETFVGELKVKEIWRLKAFEADKGFWLEIEGTTNEPRYGKVMSTIVQIVGAVEANTTCSLAISCKVQWSSRPLAAGIVESQAIPATVKGYVQFVSILKKTSRKKKTGPGAQEEEEEEEQVASPVRSRAVAIRYVLRLLFMIACAALILFGVYWTTQHHRDIKQNIKEGIAQIQTEAEKIEL